MNARNFSLAAAIVAVIAIAGLGSTARKPETRLQRVSVNGDAVCCVTVQPPPEKTLTLDGVKSWVKRMMAANGFTATKTGQSKTSSSQDTKQSSQSDSSTQSSSSQSSASGSSSSSSDRKNHKRQSTSTKSTRTAGPGASGGASSSSSSSSGGSSSSSGSKK